METRSTARPARRGALARALLAALACTVLLLALAPAARADEGVTRSVQGVNYTLPSDWSEIETPEGVLADTGLGDMALFSHEDGAFFAAALYDASLGGADLADMQEAADELASAVAGAEVPAWLGLDLPFSFSAAVEQGWPTLTAYTDAFELNGVAYGLTAKLFSVEGPSFTGGVLMVSFLPASGTVTEDFAGSFPVLEEPTQVEVAGVPYVLPAGATLARGSAFGIDFFASWQGSGAMLAVDLPIPGADAVSLSDLQASADELALSLQDVQADLEGLLPSVWAGAYDFLGHPTLGFECLADANGAGLAYIASTMTATSAGVALTAFVEPQGYGFAESVLTGTLEAAPAASSGDAVLSGFDGAAGDADGAQPSDDPGFTVGFAS